MTPKVEFHFDFGSPNAYLCTSSSPQVEQRTGAKFAYVPILLGGVFKLTNNQPPMVQFKDVKSKQDYERLEIVRFVRKHGLSQFRINPHFPVNTVQIMRGAVAAEMDGAAAPSTSTPCSATCGRRARRWTTRRSSAPRSIGSGLDGARDAGAHPGPGRQGHGCSKNTQASVARGTFGAPTFFVGDEIFFGKDRLRDVEEEIAARSRGAPEAS